MKTIHGDARKMNLAEFDRYQTIVADPPWKQNSRNNKQQTDLFGALGLE